MIRETFPVGTLQCNCTILGDEVTLEATVIDPGDDIPRILAAIARHGLTVKTILVTHAHIDHVAGAQQLKQITGAPIAFNQKDLPLLAIMDIQASWIGCETPDVRPPDEDLIDGFSVRIGNITGTVLHTPGHTQGSSCLFIPSQALLIAGDTLFARSVGRTDLPGGDAAMLLRSIHTKLLTLPDETVVVAGHGASTSIGIERERNPWLKLN
jgi:hydroxyacylglutathione hydrolase